jgi:branched-chain amino acid transport system ATP-binding protein
MSTTAAAPAGTADAMSGIAMAAGSITIKFGGLIAVNDVSFTVPERSVVSLIGPNGAGKTTFFNVLTGLYRPTSGHVMLGEKDVTGMAPHRIADLGLARTFQNIRLFNLMTAEENVLVAMHSHMRSGIFGTVLRTPHQRREEREGREFARELLDYVGVLKSSDEYARNLSYGDQRRLEVARALALRPKVLLLDEPTAGMNPQESAQFVEFVQRVRDDRGVSVLLIEHDMSVVMRVSERVTVLDRGEKIAEGSPDDIRGDERVVEAYLGKSGVEQSSTADRHNGRGGEGSPS